jgi:hypothetical protein
MKPRPGVSTSFHDYGLVLLDTSRGRLFSANRTGALIWRHIEQHASDAAIARDLSETYGLPLETASQHAQHFFAALEGEGLIERGAE